jgi:hypothetical protein
VRIDEARAEGIDAIAISDHIEYQSHSNYISGDHNSSYEIAKPYAEKKDLILIRGAEITKAMPPGHFNMIFITDANALDVPEWKESLRIANDQGAFVFWNHPGWRQQDEVPIWYAEHTEILKNKWIQGIEIVNENSYYPLAYQWAMDSNLTIVGNSDIHDPIDLFFHKCEGEHRPVTLVFASERTDAAIKDALIKKRTVVYYKDLLIGDSEFVLQLFLSSINIQPNEEGEEKDNSVLITNDACITYELILKDYPGNTVASYSLLPGVSTEVNMPEDPSQGKIIVSNILTTPDENLSFKPLLIAK